jgi:hypothetical protein
MKKNLLKLVFLLLVVTGSPAMASSVEPATQSISEVAKVATLKNRIEQIQEMDKSVLTNLEKKALRREVKSIDKELKQLAGGGIYISVGAIIIILLLIILI